MTQAEKPFWERKQLSEMSAEEWESLCDGCGKCCLYKFEDIDTGEIFYTQVACRFLKLRKTRCSEYSERTLKMPTCIVLNAENAASFRWLPETCAYRLVAEQKPLPNWHPLISGAQTTVRKAGHAVDERYISEIDIDMDHLEDYIIE